MALKEPQEEHMAMDRFIMLSRLALCTLAALALSAALSGIASAHAALVGATPAPGATLHAAPTTVTATFAEPLQPGAGTSLAVYDGRGKLVSIGAATISFSNPEMMSVGLRGAGAGTYVVAWHTVSATDGDAVGGAYAFTVLTSAAAASTTSAAANASRPSVLSGQSTVPPWFTAIIGIFMFLGGLAIGAAGRRHTTPHREAVGETAGSSRNQDNLN
jgi:copper transport protein